MKRTTKYVGLDVHHATIVAAEREETGRVIARASLPTDASALMAFVGPAGIGLARGRLRRVSLLKRQSLRFSRRRHFLRQPSGPCFVRSDRALSVSSWGNDQRDATLNSEVVH